MYLFSCDSHIASFTNTRVPNNEPVSSRTILHRLPQNDDEMHGTGVAAQINGLKVGTCKRCRVVWFNTQRWTGYAEWVQIRSQWLLHLYKAYEDIVEKGLKGKAVINLSFSSSGK